MAEHKTRYTDARRWMIPMRGRSPHETHRASTPLELFFDLVVVVAVAQNATALHHAIAEDHTAMGILHFTMIFFAIWWAWMNFSWFASAYDTDDIVYRLLVFIQMTGALIMAAGVSLGFETGNFVLMVIGYTVMRLALVPQWLRAGRSDPERRTTAYRYALGVALVQLVWLAWLALPAFLQIPVFIVFAFVELLVPAWAESAGATTWHPAHIAERYGLFTIIVLGESILSGSVAIQSVLSEGELSGALLEIIAGGLLIVFSMWWLYFDQPMESFLSSLRVALFWGYGHLLIFAAAAAVGSGLAVAVDYATHHAKISSVTAGMAVSVPVALYLAGLIVLHYRDRSQRGVGMLQAILTALLILLTPFTGHAVLLTGVLIAGLLAVKHLPTALLFSRLPAAD